MFFFPIKYNLLYGIYLDLFEKMVPPQIPGFIITLPKWGILCRKKRAKKNSPFRDQQIEASRALKKKTDIHMAMTIYRGMNIHKSHLFWCELQGYNVFDHIHMNIHR